MVYEAAANDESHDIIYLDLSKAFDKIPHDRLLSNVRAHGIDGKVLHWFRSWLIETQQRVTINGSKSKLWGWVGITSRVPQGYVLGDITIIKIH